MTIKASRLESDGGVRIESATGEIALLTDTTSAYSQEKKTGSNVVWQSTRDKGAYDQTVEHTEITAAGPIQVLAAQGIRVEYRDTGNVDDSITQLSKQPGLAWMGQLRGDPKVNWQAVAEAHEQWDYKSEGLTGAGAALLSLAVAVATSGWGSGLAASLPASVTSALGTTGTAMAAAAIEGGFASLCSQAAVGLVNNKGDVLATLQGLASDQGMRALASAMLTASLTSGLTTKLAEYEGVKEAVTAGGLAGKVAQDAVIGGTVQAGVGTALYGGDLGQNLLDGLRGAAVDSLGADLATRIGNAAKAGDLDYVTHKIAHAALGGAMAAADGGDAASGALGAVVGEVAGDLFVQNWLRGKLTDPDSLRILSKEDADKLKAENEALKAHGVDVAKLSAGMAAAFAGLDVTTAAKTGGNAAEHNVLPLIVLGGMIALELVDKGIQTYNAWQFAKAIQEGDTAKAEEYGTELALSLGTDAIAGNAAFLKMLKGFGLLALSTKIGQKVEKVAVESWRIALPKKIVELSEANIVNSGITVLGSYPGYIDKAVKNNASYFSIGKAWDTLTEAQQWAANSHFLDIIASRGDRVYLSTNVKNINHESALWREIKYLTDNKGYKVGKNGMSLYK